jgi:molecular chaperone HtpG
MNGIVFQVDTPRVLQLLTKEIYDSPLAMLRENVQNAYDAVRMRFAQAGTLTEGGRIDITIDGNQVTIRDNGIGMTEEVLKNNFWKAGSSGKHSEAARRSGVVGTLASGLWPTLAYATCSLLIHGLPLQTSHFAARRNAHCSRSARSASCWSRRLHSGMLEPR